MNALSKTKCTRMTLIILGLCLILAGPAMLLWASRPLPADSPDGTGLEAHLDQLEIDRIAHKQLPHATERPEGFSPFGQAFKDGPVRAPGDAPDRLRMNIGDLDPKNPEALLAALPAELRLADTERVGLGAKGTLAQGLNYAMLRPEAVSAKSLDAVLEGIRAAARIVSYGANSTLMLYVEAGQMGRLRQNPDVAFFHAVPPGDKISLDTGRQPFIESARAIDPNLLLEVALVPGSDAAAVRGAIARIPGVVNVADYGPAGSAFLVRADHRSLAKLARIHEVLNIQEGLEMMSLNAKESPTLQVGSASESNQARPFDDIGVDGGGIGALVCTNNPSLACTTDAGCLAPGLCRVQRMNNGTAPVPPQLVDVMDNGISADTPSFSQTATQVTDLTHPFGPAHRKVHSIINTSTGDGGDDCDAVLDGAGSHGNIVASVIGAWPSGVGAFATRSGVGFADQPRNANLDGVARGARIIVTDIGDKTRCTINSLVERGGNVDPGSLAARLNELICPKSGGTGTCLNITGGGSEVHLAVTPFGVPDNFSTQQFQLHDGTYPQQSADIDKFLYNNRDFMVFGPAGNSGVLISSSRPSFWTPRVIPDLFDGTTLDNNPNNPSLKIQIPPPSTAKNIVAVGLTRSDEFTTFEQFDNLANMATFSSRGPATPESLRMAPIVAGPGSDLNVGFLNFETASIAVFRSRDDDNTGPVDAQLDEANFGSSYAAAGVTGAAAIIRDYFAQGMYPTGDRITANRVPNISGALVKASLVASARFTTNIRTPGEAKVSPSDKFLRRTRAFDLGTISGVPIGIMGNSEQGYGRVVLTNVLPIPNWKNFRLGGVSPEGTRWTAGNTPPGFAHWEYPAQGLLVWDDIVSGEPPITDVSNSQCLGAGNPGLCCTGTGTGTCVTSQTHTFRVASANAVVGLDGGLAASQGQLRVALAWTDPPSPADLGGPLVNDLDLVLEGPGPDNCLFGGDTKPDGTTCPTGSDADNRFYDGNNYPGTGNPFSDQWSKVRIVGQAEVHDKRNPQEAIHLSFDRNNNTSPTDSQIHLGTWRVTVKKGLGGATAGHITITGPNEDTNGNRRLDTGEDTNLNGLLDLGGQTYALLVSGPVYLAEAAPSRGPSQFPQSSIAMDKVSYSCEDVTVATIFDSTTGAGASRSSSATTFSVRNAAGAIVDTENGISFTAAASPAGATTSSGVPVRQGVSPVPNNGILEADTGMQVVATYAPAGQAPVSASGRVDCAPNFVPGLFLILGNNVIGPQDIVGGGCDQDENLDAGEVVTYGVALTNRASRNLASRADDYADVIATLTPSGPGAGAIRVLDSPKNIGRLPAGLVQGAYFHVSVDTTAANALPIANRQVTLTLTLDSLSKGRRLNQLSYAFTHAINADRETLHYSTDSPGGTREVRDLNRNLIIDRPDVIDPVKLFFLPDEDVTFSSMYVPGAAGGFVSNLLGEDLDNDNLLDHGETDVVPNGVLDRGILFSASGPSSADKVPWHFDNTNGGWVPIRHPQSNVGTTSGISPNPMWEYKTSGLCGFQTSGGVLNKFGIWHTGDGDVSTPPAGATVCDNYAIPHNAQTEAKVELAFDVLQSPIIAKVNQLPDSRGFNYGVEFQRLAMNVNDEVTNAGYAAMGVNIDNNLDSDNANCLLCQEVDDYVTRTAGGWNYSVFNLGGSQTFAGEGIDPQSTNPFQRTFGPFNDPNGGGPFDGGGETGFTGQIAALNRTSPIPTAGPDFLKFPAPLAPVPGVCTGGTNPGAPCPIPGCLGGGTCTQEGISIFGPVRNFEGTLVGFEGGWSTETQVGSSAPENPVGGPIFNSGPAGNRWGIALGFFSIETTSLVSDYGFGVDDVVFEWDEFHPKDESAFSPAHTPACGRFNTPGNPSGGQCATLTVDRTNLYECEESVEITVDDPKLPASTPSVQVMIVTDSDSDPFSTDRFTVLKPNAKRYTLPAVQLQPGLFRGNVTFSGTSNTPNSVFATPGTDQQFIVYYLDLNCDGDGDGQAGESLFDNLDGDGVNAAVDNCPLTYNPLQEDGDGDGVGNLCDNCVNTANPGQEDANSDGVGDACELDDVDGDGVDNTADNCPDLSNSNQDGHCVYASGGTPGACQADTDCTTGTGGTCDKTRGFACSSSTQDLDADGRPDNIDNCVLTSNGNQRNADLDRLGDACDGDCDGISVVHICSNAPATSCTSNTDCPAGGVCQTAVRHSPSANCSASDDDADADGIEDALDDCPDIYNPTIIPGTKRQLDSDRDGLGDVCDPPGSLDDDFNGVPDDLVSFQGSVTCQQLPLGKFTVLQAVYKDIDGDQDSFPDTGETGLVTVRIRNDGVTMTGASFIMTSSDPNVDCVTFPTVSAGLIPAGAIVTVGSLIPLQAGSSFTFRASNTLESTASSTAHVNLCITANSVEVLGGTKCFSLLADLDVPPGATQTFIAGPDGIPGNADDGTLRETFDTDRNGDGVFSTADTFRLLDTGTGVVGHGSFWHSSATGVGTDVIAGVACGGFTTPAEGNTACIIFPTFAMDWHFHCPTTATNCPNTESGSFGGAAQGPCAGGCSYSTPATGQKALTAPNSMHMGAHFDLADPANGDGSHLHTIQAFVTNPINLAIVPRPNTDDLKFSFFHIVDLVDNNAVSMGPGLCADCAQVQVQTDRDPDPAVDNWGPWDSLAPFENVYESTTRAWSTFGGEYCEFTPTDTGSAPPAPRGVHETMCFGTSPNWSHCGSVQGTDEVQSFQCSGGIVDPAGKGVWVQSKFNLDGFLGQRVRIRWIASTWQLDNTSGSYFEYGPGWSDTPHDDGWWLDNIDITGVISKQVAPIPDLKPAPLTSCPISTGFNCDENASATDKGTLPRIKAVDLNGNVFGASLVPVAGQSISISAVDSTIPGGCTDGGPQFQFSKNGVVVQDWNAKSSYLDTPVASSTYSVLVRCSSDTSCTSLTAASTTVVPYSGADGNVVFGTVQSAFNAGQGVTYSPVTAVTGNTTLNVVGGLPFPVKFYRGVIGDKCNSGLNFGAPCTSNAQCALPGTCFGTGAAFYTNGSGSEVILPAPCLLPLNNTPMLAHGAGVFASGPLVLTPATDANPTLGNATFYIATDPPPGMRVAPLGCANPGRCVIAGTMGVFCSSDSQCGAGACVNIQQLPPACVTAAGTVITPPLTGPPTIPPGGCNANYTSNPSYLCVSGGNPATCCTGTGTGTCVNTCTDGTFTGVCTNSAIPVPTFLGSPPPPPLSVHGPGCPLLPAPPSDNAGGPYFSGEGAAAVCP